MWRGSSPCRRLKIWWRGRLRLLGLAFWEAVLGWVGMGWDEDVALIGGQEVRGVVFVS